MDLVHEFAVKRFPRIVELTSDADPEQQRRYLMASFRNFIRSEARKGRRNACSLERVGTISADPKNMPDRNLDVARVRETLKEVDPVAARAAELYFAQGGSKSLRAAARQLSITRHAARNAVLRALLRVALSLRELDTLSARELEACRRLVLEGATIEDTAEALKLTTHEVRLAMRRAVECLARSAF